MTVSSAVGGTTPTWRVPFHRPTLTGREPEMIAAALAAGDIGGGGPFAARSEERLEKLLPARRVLLTTSATHALEAAALLLDLQPDDEVIVPSFTFVSTAAAFVLRGARPVFVDIRRDTLNVDETQIERALSPRTRAIVPVHYAGVACEMDAIMAIAAAHGVAVVEDNAHGLFGSYRGRRLGTFGVMAALSFHATKNVTCGEGGALVVNDAALIERAETVREKGTNRAQFLRGEAGRYTWVGPGSSFMPSELQAAFLFAQLEQWQMIQARRQWLWSRYQEALGDWAIRHDVRLPAVPGYVTQPYHLFHMVMPSAERRDALIAHLASHGIQATFHYQALHRAPFGRQFRCQPGGCPIAEQVSDRLIRLPLFTSMSDADIDLVLERVRASTV